MTKQYDKGYLDGQLDAAENELETLRRIRWEMQGQHREDDMINTRIMDTEEYLRENGREVEPDEYE
ncbi:hypothetical protein [Tumebacillus lipolyticus]|uniref:Uncharacterized protein n=1 Tax=Tumebacillus lipolyticus TaxID=1280370 RepID=A0ABW5A2D3_9BACL